MSDVSVSVSEGTTTDDISVSISEPGTSDPPVEATISEETWIPLAESPPVALAPGAAIGVGTRAARSDHVHPLDGIATDSELQAHEHATTAQVEAIIKSGTAAVADNVLPPGLRIPEAYTVEQCYVRLGTAPTGADFIVEFNKNGTLFATVTVPAGVSSGSATGLSEAFVAGDVLTWDITQVGSTTAGSDVAAAVFGTLG